ncbi:MAG: AraC family transcriptional regulator [Lachnospiraceae bacterium]|nr:AraC family transcriptional regulator [Lachnospiraceae bacterium]
MKNLNLIKDNTQNMFDFPIIYQRLDSSHADYQTTAHIHREIEMIRILQGEVSVVIYENIILAKEQDVVLICDAALHQIIPHDSVYELITFDPHMILKSNCVCAKQIHNLLNFRIITPLLPTNITELNHSIHLLFTAIQNKSPGYELTVQAALYLLWSQIIQHELFTDKKTVFHKKDEIFDKFNKILIKIESDYMNPISLEELATIAGFTPKYFCKFFKFMTGYSPIDFLNKYRIEIACEYLLNSDFHISDITLLCGFNDLSYFIKTFKKYNHMAPRKWQKKWITNKKTGVTPALSFRPIAKISY